MEKTLGQISYEGFNRFKELAIFWPLGKGYAENEMQAWEAAAAAVRDATIDQCDKIVQLARAGDIDNDYRSISSRIQYLKRDWHDEDGKY